MVGTFIRRQKEPGKNGFIARWLGSLQPSDSIAFIGTGRQTRMEDGIV